ncbi:MAG TPA: hypothetical protein DHS57_01015 [Erysipelotrichaceae bacterium]|nr:hypothetical protein [Erysipelotrichaceae bacterium]
MAVKQLPTIQTIFSGEDITPTTKTTSFELGEKIENKLFIKNTDGEVEIDYIKVSNIKTINFNSDSLYTVKLTFDIGEEGILEEIEAPFQIVGNFRLDPNTDFTDKIKKITISTDSATDITVDIRIYGEKTA